MTRLELHPEILPAAWLTVLRRYLLTIAIGNFAWESAHLPLYAIWSNGAPRELIFAAVHCTGGDIVIATTSLVLALIAAGREWPLDEGAYRRVALFTIMFGLGYALFSEWLNIVVRQSWAYSELMPVIPVINVGLSPVMQWITIPLAGFWIGRRRLRRVASP